MTGLTPSMPSPYSQIISAEHSIVRSKSRYKGPRPHKTLTDPSIGAQTTQRLHNLPHAPRGPRPHDDREDPRSRKVQPDRHEFTQTNEASAKDTQGPNAFLTWERGNLRETKNHTGSQDEISPPSQALHSTEQRLSRRKCDAQVESPVEGGQDAAPSQKLATYADRVTFGLGPNLRSHHNQEAAATIGSLPMHKSGLTLHITEHSKGKRLRKGREQLKKTISAPIALEPPQGVAKPTFDAPVSAVNAGERRVNLKFDQNLISLPVTPSTTPLEIIRFAADQLAESIDPNCTVLFESFRQLGLERPLRRYERVRDVLNSWDNDTQNILVIKQSPVDGRNDWLDLYSHSTSLPVETSVYFHYSQRPGHWDKRWITLRSDGQMVLGKREGGECSKICHMSDFDIYIPTARQSIKMIKPPRKICFAVKSQQKSSMFLSTANFVHFFSTSDRTLAATWYNAVVEWRSWYLVNVMGEADEGPKGPKKSSTKVDMPKVSNNGSPTSGSTRRPLEPLDQSTMPREDFSVANYDTEHLVPSIDSVSRHIVAGHSLDDLPFRNRSEIKSFDSTKTTKDYEKPASSFARCMSPEEPGTFAATGLLGRTYAQRKAHREHEKAPNAGPGQPAATSNANPVNHLNRTLSQRPKPKPLIDLSPQYQEPPQHAKKGRGVILEQIPAGGLIEVANTPEAAIAIPPSTTWRRPSSRGGDGLSVGRSKNVRRDHSSGGSRARSEPKQTVPSLENGNIAFTGGLLATNSSDHYRARMGRGTTTENRQAKEPTLKVGEGLQYAPSSLLERVERYDGPSHQIDDKEKKREMMAAADERT